MTEDFHDFEVEFDFRRSIPEWAWRQGGFKARAFRSAIEAAGGEILSGETLAKAFSHCSIKIQEAASRKLIAIEGMVDDEPLPIVAADIIL